MHAYTATTAHQQSQGGRMISEQQCNNMNRYSGVMQQTCRLVVSTCTYALVGGENCVIGNLCSQVAGLAGSEQQAYMLTQVFCPEGRGMLDAGCYRH